MRSRRLATPFLLCLFLGSTVLAASRPPVGAPRGIVVAPEARAAEVGLEVLRRGGRAADAAVATAFALSVTYPLAGSLGGGGFAIHRRESGETIALDFREVAPGALKPRLFLDDAGRVVARRATDTGLGVGVPGLPAGLARLHAEEGILPWVDLIAPAIRLAESGVRLSPFQAAALAREADRIRGRQGARALLFREDGSALVESDRLVQPDLARTLRRLARDGPDAFYGGPVAERIVDSVRREGGIMTLEDLSSYRVERREPLTGAYRGHPILTFPPPSSGGLAVLQILGLMERWDVGESGPLGSRTVHLMAEAERRAFEDRAQWLGDPDSVDVPVARLLDAAYLSRRAASIDESRATPTGEPVRPEMTAEDGETLHLSIADARGNVVAMTITLNFWFGSGIVASGTGILLNNQMADFTLSPSTPDPYGLTGSRSNIVAGRKRPVSSMTPTVVLHPDGKRPRLVLGSPGGPTIITTVAQIISRVLDHGMDLQEAVDAPRFHHQGVPNRIDHERFAFSEDVALGLRQRGHFLRERASMGSANVVGWDPEKREWQGAADPRRDGVVRGY